MVTFTVRRSRFAVRRSLFAVHCSLFAVRGSRLMVSIAQTEDPDEIELLNASYFFQNERNQECP